MKTSLRYITCAALLMLALALNGCGSGVSNPDVTLLDKTSSLTRNQIRGNVYELITLNPTGAGRVAGDAGVQVATGSIVMHAATDSAPFDPASPDESATSSLRVLQIPESTASKIVVPKPGIEISCGGKTTQTNSNGYYKIQGFEVFLPPDTMTQEVICEIEGETFSITLGSLYDTGPFNVQADYELYGTSFRFITLASNVSTGNLYINGATTTGRDSFPTKIKVDNSKEYKIRIGSEGYETSDNYIVEECNEMTCADENVTITLRPLVTDIQITIAGGGGRINPGETLQLAATCSYIDGTSGDCTEDVVWKSGNTAVGTVNATGLLSMLTSGSVDITATRKQSDISSSPVTITTGASTESTCDGVTGVCLDLVGASIAPGGSAVVSVVASAAPDGGITAGELKLTWEDGLTLSSATAASGVKIWSQDLIEPSRTFAAVYTAADVIASGDTIMTLKFTADANVTDPVNVNWISSSDEYTDITDASYASWDQGSFTLRGALLDVSVP